MKEPLRIIHYKGDILIDSRSTHEVYFALYAVNPYDQDSPWFDALGLSDAPEVPFNDTWVESADYVIGSLNLTEPA